MEKEKNKIRQILNVIGTFITVLLVVLAVLTAVGMVRQHMTGQPFTVLGFKPVIIQTGSMEPTIKTNAVVIVKQTKDVKENDILLFQTESGFVVHRYYDTDEETGSIITKGDANDTADYDLLDIDNVFGKVVFIANFAAPIVHLITGNTGVG